MQQTEPTGCRTVWNHELSVTFTLADRRPEGTKLIIIGALMPNTIVFGFGIHLIVEIVHHLLNDLLDGGPFRLRTVDSLRDSHVVHSVGFRKVGESALVEFPTLRNGVVDDAPKLGDRIPRRVHALSIGGGNSGNAHKDRFGIVLRVVVDTVFVAVVGVGRGDGVEWIHVVVVVIVVSVVAVVVVAVGPDDGRNQQDSNPNRSPEEEFHFCAT
mmetsp:Transcript_29065/g.67716  ORF Transcript_29065/g.67716 Transcript_29065/m.67716 type:complete len:213 (-) Transcript_29065:85-723(-)